MTAPPRRRTFPPVLTALAVLGWGGAFPGDARAGCGDYVQIVGAEPAEPPKHPGEAPAAPCRGPACDRPAVPAAPPPAPVTASPIQLDAVLVSIDPADAPPRCSLSADPSPGPAAFPAAIFRPPR